MRTRRCLIAILLLAATLRFVGIKPGLNKYHPDEPIIYGVAVELIRNKTLDPGRYDYPSTVTYLNAFWYKTFFIPLAWLQYYLSHVSEIIDGKVHIPITPLEKIRIRQVEIFGHREINVLFWGRYITAAFGVGNVFLVYLLGEKLFNKKAGLLAAIFLAFNFKHVVNSHIGLPDIYNSFFLLVSLLASFNLWQKPTKKNYFWAGLAAGLSVAIKYQIFALLPLGLAHLFGSRKLFNKGILIALLLVPLVFFVTNPYFLINFEEALSWMLTVSQKYGMGTRRINLFPLSYLFRIDFGPPLAIVGLLGLIYTAFDKPKKFLFLFSVLFLFGFLFLYYSTGGFYIRNLIVMSPILLIFAAFLYAKLPNALILITLPLLLFVPAKNSLMATYYFTKPWTYEILSDWLYKNWQEDWVLAAHPFDPPTGSPPLKKTEFELDGAFSLTEHRDNGADYALLNTDWAGNPFYGWMHFGFNRLPFLWRKPTEILKNSFHGLAAEELFRYQVFAATKPWQVADAGLVLSKLSEWPEVEMGAIQKGGSLHLLIGRNKFGIEKVSLAPIEIKGGHLYKVRAFVKSGVERQSRQRDGFLRVDFYREGDDFGNRGLVAAVSSRVWGKEEWSRREIIEWAPQEANFLIVSLQASGVNCEFWAKDIVIEESVPPVVDITSQPPYHKSEIDLNLLYPNSHGNL